MPEREGGPCQAVDAEDNTLCGETWSTCWYGKTKKGVHFCSSHRGAWEQFKLNGTAEKADEATALTDFQRPKSPTNPIRRYGLGLLTMIARATVVVEVATC